MSEYWKSTPKYWCKHCSIYIRDTSFEKKQHESTAKHQGNLKRFLRDIQNNHERDERDKQKAKSEVERLNKTFGGSTSTANTPTTSNTRRDKHPTTALSASDQKRQWSQLAQMGIEVPEDFLCEVAMVGQWQKTPATVVKKPPTQEETHSVGVHKRKIDETDEVGAAGETADDDVPIPATRRKWGSSLKQHPREEDDDLDALFSTSQLVKREKAENTKPPLIKDEATTEAFVPQRNDGDVAVTTESQTANNWDVPNIKSEQDQSASDVLDRDPPPAPLPIFKKRKAKTGGM